MKAICAIPEMVHSQTQAEYETRVVENFQSLMCDDCIFAGAMGVESTPNGSNPQLAKHRSHNQ